jgi:acetoin utilization protein AcuB
MLVRNWMTKNVIKVDENDPIDVVKKTLEKYGIHSVPVTREGILIGIITKGDIDRASVSELPSLERYEISSIEEEVLAKEIMSKTVITVSPISTIDEVAEVLLKNKILATPVIDENSKIIGIFTKSDIFKALISLTGMDKRGFDLGIQVADTPGAVKEVTDIIRSYKGQIASILISYEKAPVGFRNVHVRIYHINRADFAELKKELFKLPSMLYLFDYFEQSREVFTTNGG